MRIGFLHSFCYISVVALNTLVNSAVLQAANSYTLAAEADRVHDLPGLEALKSGLFSGYVTVNETAGRALYYILSESESSASAPLVLWLNGGPGCSSLGGGFMSELGPVYPTPDGQLQYNRHAWTKEAHMLFVDSPAFVGFSYSNTSDDKIVGDRRTAEDLRAFLVGFFLKFPALASRPFWISGESYGGHYVPNLALEILRSNKRDPGRAINLQGFLVGNAWTSPYVDNRGAVDFWWSHAIISDNARDSLLNSCNFSGVGPLLTVGEEDRCSQAVQSAWKEFAEINIYDVYVDTCVPRGPGQQLGAAARSHPYAFGPYMAFNSKYDPCVDNEVQTYLNRPEVQQALHVNLTGKLPGPWTDCSPYVQYSQTDLFASMIPVYELLLQSNLQMLVFSGDVDGIVPVIGTRRWIADLGLPVTSPWRAWHSLTGQVGGHTESFGRLHFATVRNAGHMVPYTQPERAFAMFKSWITSAKLPG